MIAITVAGYDDWRSRARSLLQSEVAPDHIHWQDGASPQEALFGQAEHKSMAITAAAKVPRSFLALAKNVACNRDPGRWALLYRLLWRVTHENHDLLKVSVDDDVLRAERMADEVKREIHRMHAFVRFRKVASEGGAVYIAWFRPDHFILRAAAPFFVDRFRAMRWSILTPEESAHWNGSELSFTAGAPRNQAPQDDELEDLWRSYYGATFNPARVNLKLMRQLAPQRYWTQMPEMDSLAQELAEAPARVERMIKLQPKGAAAYIPSTLELAILRGAVQSCRGCDLHNCATQAVFGEGPADARIMLIGEQPGDQEDLAGRPFVGPAGEVLNRAISQAGLNRSQIYVTNAVKHFAFEERGKRRIHRTPRLSEVTACRPWVETEMASIQPEIVVCLGATAAKALLGTQFRITADRGKFFATRWAAKILPTYHPSAVLRAETQEHSDEIYAALLADLRRVAQAMRGDDVSDSPAAALA